MRLRTIYPLLISLFAWAAFSSCSPQHEVNSSQQANSVTFSIDYGTNTTQGAVRAVDNNKTGIPVTALDNEKKINKLTAVLFRSGTMVQVIESVTTTDATKTKGSFSTPSAGEYTFVLVANASTDLIAKIKKSINLTTFFDVVADQEPQGANPLNDDFLMLSQPQTVTTQSNSSVNAGTIQLQRCAVRIDVYSAIEGLTINKLTLQNAYTSSLLSLGSRNTMPTSGLTRADVSYNFGGVDKGTYAVIGKLYTYENIKVGDTKILLEGFYKTKPFTHTITVADLPLQRNHIYSIILSSSSKPISIDDVHGIKFDIVVNDWNKITLPITSDQLVKWSSITSEFKIQQADKTKPYPIPATPGRTDKFVVTPLASDFIIELSSTSSAVYISSPDLPDDFTVVADGPHSSDGGKTYKVKYTIHFAANAEYADKNFNFFVNNPINPADCKSFLITQKARRPSPLTYMPNYPMANYNAFATKMTAPGSLPMYTTGTTRTVMCAFYWPDAMKFFPSVSGSKKPEGWHFPCMEEWTSILPPEGAYNGPYFVNFRRSGDYGPYFYIGRDFNESIIVPFVTKTPIADYKAEYYNTSSTVCYAVRLMHNGDDKDYTTVFKYEYGKTIVPQHPDKGEAGTLRGIKISAIYVGPEFWQAIQKEADLEDTQLITVNRKSYKASMSNPINNNLYKAVLTPAFWSQNAELMDVRYMTDYSIGDNNKPGTDSRYFTYSYYYNPNVSNSGEADKNYTVYVGSDCLTTQNQAKDSKTKTSLFSSSTPHRYEPIYLFKDVEVGSTTPPPGV